jgi:hypothetical protein
MERMAVGEMRKKWAGRFPNACQTFLSAECDKKRIGRVKRCKE